MQDGPHTGAREGTLLIKRFKNLSFVESSTGPNVSLILLRVLLWVLEGSTEEDQKSYFLVDVNAGRSLLTFETFHFND